MRSATIASSGVSVSSPVGVERRPLGQPRDEQVGQQAYLVPGDCRHRHDLCPVGFRPRAEVGDVEQVLRQAAPGSTRSVLVATAILTVRRTFASSVTRKLSPGPMRWSAREARRDHVDLAPRSRSPGR